MEHTKEPWKTVWRGDDECCDIDAKGPDGWPGDVTIALNIGKGNARRIVACVNSFAGISTENIETNLPVKELARRYNVAAQHREVLLKALEQFKRADNEDQLIAAMDNANKVMKDIFGIEGGAQ